jgi:hypothetical protein
MRLALDILEGQNLARKNDHRVGPRCAGASELASVDALDRDCQFVALGQRFGGVVSPNCLFTFVDGSLLTKFDPLCPASPIQHTFPPHPT